MDQYLKLVIKAMDLVENDPTLSQLCRVDAQYQGRLSLQKKMAVFGVPYYTLVPFIFERLAAFFTYTHRAHFRYYSSQLTTWM